MRSSKKFQTYSTYLEWKEEQGVLSHEDATLVHSFMDEYASSRGIADSTGMVNAQYLTNLLVLVGKPAREMTHGDILAAVATVRRRYKPNSQAKFISGAKLFSEWLVSEGYNDRIQCEKVNSIKPPRRPLITVRKEEILSPDEMQQIIDACRTVRDKAVVATAYEAAMRAIEVVKLKWRDVEIDTNGAVLHTSEKTGEPRRIRITTYAPHLIIWKGQYRSMTGDEPEGNAPVFVNLKPAGPLSYQGYRKILYTAAKRANIKKRVHPHGLRHARITAMLESGISESSVKKVCWGKLTTPMLAVYEHISDEHLDKEVLQAAGIVPREKKEHAGPKAEICRCGTICGPGSRFCHVCGSGLTAGAVSSLRGMADDIDHDLSALQELIDHRVKLAMQNEQ